MKTGMKKIAACLVALLMTAQAAPALMEGGYSSNVTFGSLEGFRDAMEIVCDGGSHLLTGDTVTLSANENYQPVWTSSDPAVVSVTPAGTASATATINAVGVGTADITAVDGKQTKVFRVTVVDPEVLVKDQKTSAKKEKVAIVVNGITALKTYNGEAQSHNEYTVSSSSAAFDPAKVKLNRDITVTETECGYYKMNLSEKDFSYEDDGVIAVFAVYDGYLKITAAKVTVQADSKAKEAGQADPALTATVTGLIGDDTIRYELYRDPGEGAGFYLINADGAEQQGNYRIQYQSGVLTITEPAPVIEEPEVVEPEPEVVEAEPEAVEAEPETVEAEPETVEAEPEAVEAEPETVEAEPETVEAEPEVVEAEPEAAETEPEVAEGEPEAVEGEPEAVEGESEEVEAEPEAAEEQPVERAPLTVNAYALNNGPINIGDQVILKAEVTGAEEGEYTIQWQYSKDMENWQDAEGGNGLVYAFNMTVKAASYAWRVVVDWAD